MLTTKLGARHTCHQTGRDLGVKRADLFCCDEESGGDDFFGVAIGHRTFRRRHEAVENVHGQQESFELDLEFGDGAQQPLDAVIPARLTHLRQLIKKPSNNNK